MVSSNVVRIMGTLPGGEVWSVNPKYGADSVLVIGHEELQAWADAIGELNSGTLLPSDLRASIGLGSYVTGVRVEHRDNQDKLVAAAERILPSPVQGAGSIRMPHTVAMVVSLRTALAGRAYRGRLYWPALARALESDARFSPVNALATATATAELLQDIADAALTATGRMIFPAVVSQIKGVQTRITSVSAGDVPDTQRRRRDALAESHSVAVMPEPAEPEDP